MNGEYRKALRISNLSREQVAQVCVDLKSRIQGKFHIIEEDEDKIIFGNNLIAKRAGRVAKGLMFSKNSEPPSRRYGFGSASGQPDRFRSPRQD